MIASFHLLVLVDYALEEIPGRGPGDRKGQPREIDLPLLVEVVVVPSEDDPPIDGFPKDLVHLSGVSGLRERGDTIREGNDVRGGNVPGGRDRGVLASPATYFSPQLVGLQVNYNEQKEQAHTRDIDT